MTDRTRYAAKLVFQFRPVRQGISRKRRVCEERIVTFTARSPREALSRARSIGQQSEYSEQHDETNVYFEFIGVLELKEMNGVSTERHDEVWWEYVERVEPMENRSRLIPRESELEALRRAVGRKKKMRAWCERSGT